MRKAGLILNKNKPTASNEYDPSKVAPSWEEGLESGQYSTNVGLNYNPLKQEKSIGIIKNPSGLINAIGTLAGLPV
jgi:hypothetical protein